MAEEIEKPEQEDEYVTDWGEVVIEALHSSNLNERVKQYLELKITEISARKNHITWSSIFHLILSITVILGVFCLTYSDKLDKQTAATLIGAIVGYLFGRGRR